MNRYDGLYDGWSPPLISGVYMRGVFLDAGSLNKADIDMAPLGRGSVAWAYYDFTSPSAVAERIAEAEIVISEINERIGS